MVFGKKINNVVLFEKDVSFGQDPKTGLISFKNLNTSFQNAENDLRFVINLVNTINCEIVNFNTSEIVDKAKKSKKVSKEVKSDV